MRRSFYVILLLALFLAPLYMPNNYVIRILVLVCLFGAAATGWNLLGGYANQISLGHTVFFGLGAYSVVILQGTYGSSPWLGIPIGIVCSVIVAVMIGWPTFQLSGHYFALATLALLPVFAIVATFWNGLTGGPLGISVPILESGLGTLQFDTPVPFFYVAAVLLVLVMILARWVRYSRFGLQLDAIRLNPDAATLAGVDMFRAKMKALVLSAVVVSIAGSFYGAFLQFVEPGVAFSWTVTINVVLFSFVGGVRYWWGPALGAFILIPLSEYAKLQLRGNAAELGQMAFGVVLILIVLFQPRGVGGLFRTIWRKAVDRKRV